MTTLVDNHGSGGYPPGEVKAMEQLKECVRTLREALTIANDETGGVRSPRGDTAFMELFKALGLIERLLGIVPEHRFARTYCSQCGTEIGPGQHGVSHCDQHQRVRRAS